jgi:hypothetical protein
MNKNSIVITTLYNEQQIEAFLKTGDAELKHLAQKSARSLGERNLPTPLDDSIVPYIREFKSGYERLCANFLQQIQPETHKPEGGLDITRAKEKLSTLQWKIDQLEEKNRTDIAVIKDFDPSILLFWVRKVCGLLMIIISGEIIYNMKAFQVIGESLIYALLLSLCASVAILVFGDLTAMLYKLAKNKLERISIVIVSLLIVGALFYEFGVLRSSYLSSHGTSVHPLFFVIINLFFFVVSALLSYFFLPSWQEIKEHINMMKLYRPYQNRLRESARAIAEKESIQDAIHEMSKGRIRLMNYAEYSKNTIGKMYHETVGLFIRLNITYRVDRKTPDCFSQSVPELDMGSIDKGSQNNNNDNLTSA